MSITRLRVPVLEQPSPTPVRPQLRRLVLLCLFLLLALGSTLFLKNIAPVPDGDGKTFVAYWLLSFLPYLACSLFILLSRPQSGRWQWVELGIILSGALLMRILFLPIWPALSRDSWRYLWDARVTLLGYSPYVYTPDNPALSFLHDTLIYDHMGYHSVPTLYPPVAQAVYLLSYLLSPSNIVVLKTLFVGFDLISCCLLALLLKRKGLDPARCLIYAWCPLPIVEFAMQGHIDVVMITFLLLFLFCATSTRRGMRLVTGFVLGLATLTKLYPIILLVVVLRRRDYGLLATCVLTIILGYIPYFILGHGHVLGFFSTYLSQHGGNGGVIMLVLYAIEQGMHLQKKAASNFEHSIDLAIAGGMALIVWFLRLRERISIETAILLLIGTIFSISTFVYPWYVTTLLPWVALLIGPLWTRTAHGDRRLQARTLLCIAAWYLACTSASAYFFLGASDWRLYHFPIYGVICLLSGVAGIVAIVGTVENYNALLVKLPSLLKILPVTFPRKTRQ